MTSRCPSPAGGAISTTPCGTDRPSATLEAAFDAGERAIKRAVRDLAVVEVVGIAAAALADADTPDELP